MPTRRYADPTCVQHVWDAVKCTQQQRQLTDMPRLTKYLQKVCGLTANQADHYVRRVFKDNLLVSLKKTGLKGTKVGMVTECYKIPSSDNNTPVDDGHDWYCIECHLAGDVVCCQSCYRVFHSECAVTARNNTNKFPIHLERSSISKSGSTNPSPTKPSSIVIEPDVSSSDKEEKLSELTHSNPDVCSVCRMLQDEKPDLIPRDELNYLLNFTLNRIRIWLPSNITDTMAPRVPHPWMTEQEVAWRVRQLLYQTMDIPIMEMKLRTKEYTRLAEFHADVITIQHNVAIFHGLESQEMQGSELMLTDSKYDLVELQQCVDCYRHSNEKRNDFWFCIPCRPQHQLVWAKQKGYPYWPAKVIRVTPEGGQHDVRFFGAKHLRALIEKHNVRPIDTNVQKLQVKRTQAFNKAMQELTEHQRLLKNPEEVAKIMMQTPEIKFKTSTTKNKQKLKRLKSANPNSTEVFESFESPVAESSTVVVEKKKRGRKPGSGDHKKKAAQKIRPPTDRLKPSSTDGHESTDSRTDHVSSSTENVFLYQRPTLCMEADGLMASRSRSGSSSGGSAQQLDRAYSDPVENLRRQLEQMPDKDTMIRVALDTMQNELDRLENAHSEHIRSMVDAQNLHISEIKKKQWCYNCEQEAIYHCCWNTAYCSTVCQQQHWQSEHKRVCRRKR